MFQVKQYSALFPKDFVSQVLVDALGGASIVLDGVAPNGVPLIPLGYIYTFVFCLNRCLMFFKCN